MEAAKDADILIFVLPHQFIRTLCSTLLDNIKPTAVGLSLIKVSIYISSISLPLYNVLNCKLISSLEYKKRVSDGAKEIVLN